MPPNQTSEAEAPPTNHVARLLPRLTRHRPQIPAPMGSQEIKLDLLCGRCTDEVMFKQNRDGRLDADAVEGVLRQNLRTITESLSARGRSLNSQAGYIYKLEQQNEDFYRALADKIALLAQKDDEIAMLKTRFKMGRPTPTPDILEKLLLAVDIPAGCNTADLTEDQWKAVIEDRGSLAVLLMGCHALLMIDLRQRITAVVESECPLVPADLSSAKDAKTAKET